MKKVVVKLDVHGDKAKQKAMLSVSALSGVNQLSMDMKDKKLTVIGDIDPLDVVGKLRKQWHAEIVTVGPEKEPEKKEESKKEEPKKEETKKDPVAELVKAYQNYNPHMTTHYFVRSIEENPNACVIC